MVSVFGSSGSSGKRGSSVFEYSLTEGRFQFQFRFPEKGSGSSGSAFGSWRNMWMSTIFGADVHDS